MSTILDGIGGTPLVRLGRIDAGCPTPIYAKCEHLNPGGSTKDRIALAIVDEAEAQGRLAPGQTLIEATAGNTGMGLALVAAVRGYRLACVMPEKMSEDKRVALRLVGAEVIITPNAPLGDARNFQSVARRLAAERGWFLCEQFENPANIRAHYEGTAVEILAQVATSPDGPHVGAFVAGAGTGGTITGVGRRLREHAALHKTPAARVVLADPVGSALFALATGGAPASDAPYAVEGIGQSRAPKNLDLSVIDEAEAISDEESFAMCGRLWREEGLLVGGSSGTAVAAALRVARRGGLAGPVVAVLADSWDRYHSKPWARSLVASGGASTRIE